MLDMLCTFYVPVLSIRGQNGFDNDKKKTK